MNKNLQERPIRVGMIALGCAKNMVDAEIMLGSMLRDGMEITNDPSQADALIVNTCSFIGDAQEESVDAILEAAHERDARSPSQALVVSGCLPQRFREELPELMSEVDAFMGVDQVSDVTQIVRQALAHRASQLQHPAPPRRPPSKKSSRRPAASAPSKPLVSINPRPAFVPDYETPRFRLTPRHLAYVKIAEGCNHPCSFCIIPRIRGPHRSRPLGDIVKEVRRLLDEGVKELNLISQDSTFYGLDLRPRREGSIARPDRFRAAAQALPVEVPTLPALLRELNALRGDFWIRLLYTHPAHWTDDLIGTFNQCSKVARYVDIPLQHIHDDMLTRMRRETSRRHIVDLLGKIRAGIPGIALRTTFIVGFPGETEACFASLLDFIREIRFERLGVFAYSREEGTVAGKMSGQIPEDIKQRRRALAMSAQHDVAQAMASAMVGRTLRVLVEGEASAPQIKAARLSSWEHGLIRETDRHASQIQGRYWVARSQADAPDIDGRVFIRGQVEPGGFARVKIVGHTDYDLIAQPA